MVYLLIPLVSLKYGTKWLVQKSLPQKILKFQVLTVAFSCVLRQLPFYVVTLNLFLLSTLSPSPPLDETNTIHLKCNVASSTESYSVLDHQVPVFICNKDALTSSEWDITTQQVNNLGIFPLYLTLSYNMSQETTEGERGLVILNERIHKQNKKKKTKNRKGSIIDYYTLACRFSFLDCHVFPCETQGEIYVSSNDAYCRALFQTPFH